jgi:GTP-binding nuclear protein Ran
MSQITTYKLILAGDSIIGKSTFIKRHATGEFTYNYMPTIGVEVTPIKFLTNNETICFNVWDVSGNPIYQGIADGYYIQADCAVIMFDVLCETSYKNIKSYYQKIREICGNIPIVFCGNKVDKVDRVVKPKQIKFPREVKCNYYDISAKSNYNFEKPFLYLARILKDKTNLNFDEQPINFNISIKWIEYQMDQLNNEVKEIKERLEYIEKNILPNLKDD